MFSPRERSHDASRSRPPAGGLASLFGDLDRPPALRDPVSLLQQLGRLWLGRLAAPHVALAVLAGRHLLAAPRRARVADERGPVLRSDLVLDLVTVLGLSLHRHTRSVAQL